TAGTVTYTTGGAISRTGGTLGTSGSSDLTLSAVSGIGNIGGTAPVVIGTIGGGDLIASNTGSGDLYLSTGTITLGTLATQLSQHAAGHLRVDSSGDITIGGNQSVGLATGTGA